MGTTQPAPAGCLPDVLTARIAEIAAASGETFDEVMTGLIYAGMCNWMAAGHPEMEGIDLIKLSQELDEVAA